MKRGFFLIIIFFAFLLESKISVFGARPNLTVAIAYYLGLKNGEGKGLIFGAMIGIIGDSLSGGVIGPNMLGKGLAGFFAALMSGSFFRWTPLLGIIGIASLTVFDGIIVFVSRAVFEHMPTSVPNAIFITLISAAINSVSGAFIKPKDD
ncbi:MAG: rod shape-determining protein MreD [Nitrospirae bacterium]|nr:rod shape-determining protein MreD [Nitrospirota bacterium]